MNTPSLQGEGPSVTGVFIEMERPNHEGVRLTRQIGVDRGSRRIRGERAIFGAGDPVGRECGEK